MAQNPDPSLLDQQQILQRAFQEDSDTLRVDTQATIIAGAIEVSIDSSTDSVRVADATGDDLEVNPDGSINVLGVVEVVNTTGAGAVNIQDGGNSITIDGTVNAVQSGTWNINNISGTVSLPTGASTSANQNTEITSLQIIDDIPHSQNTTLSKGVPIMGQLDDTSIVVPSEDNVAAIRITAQRAAHVNLRRTDGTAIGTSSDPLKIDGNVNSAASDSGAPVKIGGVFNTTLPTVTNGQRIDTQTDANGRTIVTNNPLDGSKPTYRAASAAFTAAASATDIATITGSSTKTIRVTRMMITGIQTTASEINMFILKRSTANTGGTSSTLTNVSMDSNDAAATATVRTYTANPTTGTLVGNISSFKMDIPVTAVGGNATTVPIPEIKFGDGPSKAVVLRGTGEVLAFNLGGVSVSGGSFLFTVEWTEE